MEATAASNAGVGIFGEAGVERARNRGSGGTSGPFVVSLWGCPSAPRSAEDIIPASVQLSRKNRRSVSTGTVELDPRAIVLRRPVRGHPGSSGFQETSWANRAPPRGQDSNSSVGEGSELRTGSATVEIDLPFIVPRDESGVVDTARAVTIGFRGRAVTFTLR